jgi:hypothetical protein
MFVYINRDPKFSDDLTTDEALLGMTLEEQWEEPKNSITHDVVEMEQEIMPIDPDQSIS